MSEILNNDMKAHIVYFNKAKSPKLKVQLWISNATKLVMFNFPPYLLRNSATWERKMKLPGSEFILLFCSVLHFKLKRISPAAAFPIEMQKKSLFGYIFL